MEFRVLGPLEVVRGEVAVEVRRGHPRLILLALVLRVGETLSPDLLADLVWGEQQPANPANALQTQVSYLRKALGGTTVLGGTRAPGGTTVPGGTTGDGQVLVTRPGGYALDVAPDHVDAVSFQRSLERARRLAEAATGPALDAARRHVEAALGLWRGEPLVEASGHPFAAGEASRLGEARLAAFELRAECLLALGRHREAAADLASLVTDHPLRERFHELLMLSHYRSGRQADALRTYDAARAVLLDELGLDPGPGLQRLQQQVLEQSPELTWHPPADEVQLRPAEAERPLVPAGVTANRAVGGSRSSLPAPLTELIGRDREVEQVQQLLERGRLVTLTGPGGAGKTSLAVQLARRWEEGPAWFVDLDAVDHDDLVPLAAAAALGAPTSPTADPIGAIAAALGDRPGLVVLDTCEHVVSGAARLVSGLLALSPQLRILATSRRPLAVRGETSWPVPPLGLPGADLDLGALSAVPSVALFVERATAVRPDFALTERNADDVGAVCRSLDGLPLAIELAAARADTLSPAAIRHRLADRFALLVDGGRDAAERQQTLRATLDWSYELLDAEERQLFVVLSVFAGPFGLDELAAVAGDDRADPVRPLAGLVRQSMVAVVDEDRYQLLDTPRQYGRELLAAWPEVEADAVHERHARAYVAVAASGASGLWSPQQAESLARLRAALPNLRAALDWSFDSGRNELGARIAGSLAWFFMLEGMFAEGRSYLERADRSGNELSRFARTWVAYGLGLLAAPLGELDQARQASQRAVELAREGRDVLGMAAGLSALGVTDWALGDLDRAALHQDESVRLYEAAGDPWRKADILVLRARTAADQRDPRARAMLEEAIPLARSVGDLHASGMALAQLSLLAFADRDYATAARSATEALAAHEALNEPEATAGALHLLGRATLACGDVDAARALHRRGLELASAIGHVGAMCEAVEDFAALAAAVGDLRTAAGLLAVAARQRSARGVRLRPLEQDLLDRLWGEVAAAVVDGGAATVAAVGGDLAERRFEGGEFAERPFGAVIAELRGNGRILGR